jgi:hypothetical protein
MIFAASSLKHSSGNSLGYIERPALGDIKSHHSGGLRVLAVQDIAHDGPFIGFCLVLFRAPFGLPDGLPLFPGLKAISQWSVVSRLYFQ